MCCKQLSQTLITFAADFRLVEDELAFEVIAPAFYYMLDHRGPQDNKPAPLWVELALPVELRAQLTAWCLPDAPD